MIDTNHGTRDSRTEWQPRILTPPPLCDWPPRPLAALKWMFGYPGFFLPWTTVLMMFPLVTWFFLTPDLEKMKSFEIDWIAAIFLRNLRLLILVAGGFHLRFYVQKAQGTRYKYNKNWLGKHQRFLFGDQTRSIRI